jgi:hypothetical protein
LSTQLDDWVLCRIYNKKGVIERHDTVDDDGGVKPAAPAAKASIARGPEAMKVETPDYAFYDGYETEAQPAAEMLCFDRPFQADRGSAGSVPRPHTDNSSCGSEHVLSPSPDLPDRDHAESQPLGAGWLDGIVDWGGGDGFVVDAANLFGMPSPGGFTSARDAVALGEMVAYLQRPF